MGSIGYCLNLFSKKKKKKKKKIYIYIYIYINPLWLIYVVKKTTTTESKYFVLNKLFLEFPCL